METVDKPLLLLQSLSDALRRIILWYYSMMVLWCYPSAIRNTDGGIAAPEPLPMPSRGERLFVSVPIKAKCRGGAALYVPWAEQFSVSPPKRELQGTDQSLGCRLAVGRWLALSSLAGLRFGGESTVDRFPVPLLDSTKCPDIDTLCLRRSLVFQPSPRRHGSSLSSFGGFKKCPEADFHGEASKTRSGRFCAFFGHLHLFEPEKPRRALCAPLWPRWQP